MVAGTAEYFSKQRHRGGSCEDEQNQDDREGAGLCELKFGHAFQNTETRKIVALIAVME